MYALVDGNNFYVSCERVFRPSLLGRPVIVLSNNQLGVHTALDVARMDPRVVRKRWSVVLERTVREIQGQPCIDLQTVAPANKEIAVTRTFDRPLTALPDLIEAVTAFACRAGEKLRKQEHRAGQVLTFIHTSPFRKQDRQYSRSITVPLRIPSCDSSASTSTAVRGLRAIFKPGFNYAKAGVMLLDLQTADIEQGELDLDEPGADRRQLMDVLDSLNDRYGRNTVSPTLNDFKSTTKRPCAQGGLTSLCSIPPARKQAHDSATLFAMGG